MQKRIGFYCPDRDHEELFVPALRMGLERHNVTISTQKIVGDPSLVGYTGIYAEGKEEDLVLASGFYKGMQALYRALCCEDEKQENKDLRSLVLDNLECG